MILSRNQILKYLPHRDPFLFIDEVVSLEEGSNIHAVMYVKNDSVFFFRKLIYFIYTWINILKISIKIFIYTI